MIAIRSRVDSSKELLDDTAIDITLSVDANTTEEELAEMRQKRQQRKKSRGCRSCCGSNQRDNTNEDVNYGQYRMGIPGDQKYGH